MDSNPDSITYTVDEDTLELLETALNMLAQVAELQATDEGLASVYALANEIADRFNIPSRVATVTEQDGVLTVTYNNEEDEGTVH